MTTTEIFTAPNNDGTGRCDYHLSVTGEIHTAIYGPFRNQKAAEKEAARRVQQKYWDTGEGDF